MAGYFVLDFVVCKHTVSGKRWQNISHNVALSEMPNTQSELDQLVEKIKDQYQRQPDVRHVFFLGTNF